MAGKVALVTGATDGIGRATALGLARLGARVLVHGRDPERVAAAARETDAAGPGRAEGLVADLSVQDEVRRLAAQAGRAASRLDVLVNNAGVYMRDRRLTPDGVEQTFAVNVLAPFLLMELLRGALEAAAPSRVVNVASMAHRHARLDLAAFTGGGPWHGGEAYAASKLALVLLSAEAADRFADAGITVNSLHPGVVRTKLLRAGWPYGAAAGGGAERGARTSIYLASAADVQGVTGRYFVRSRPAEPSPLAGDREARAALWEACRRLTGLVPSTAPSVSPGGSRVS
jgi:NAD(P)-dependent dehydrogenase (short-subunit alcohol dehydrogenase family)